MDEIGSSDRESLLKNVQVREVLLGGSYLLLSEQVRDFVDVSEGEVNGLAFLSFCNKFEDVAVSLRHHHRVVSFVSRLCSCVPDNRREARECLVTSTATSHPCFFRAVEILCGVDGLEAGEDVMHLVHFAELILLFNFSAHLCVEVVDVLAVEVHHEHFGEQDAKGVSLRLVIKDRALFGGPVHCLELSPHDTVPDADENRLLKLSTAEADNHSSDSHHDGVQHSQVSLSFEVALSVDFNIAHQEIGARDSHLVETRPTVVFGEVTDLGADISR